MSADLNARHNAQETAAKPVEDCVENAVNETESLWEEVSEASNVLDSEEKE